MQRWCWALLVSLVAVVALPAPAAAEGAYSPPVDARVVDRFRPPANPYGPGNRGIDYDTDRGEEVRAAAGGEVVFAGRVGGGRHVVVLHPDGLRTSYSFLGRVDVARGDHVARGDVVGAAGVDLHFGVRAGDDRYLDPEALLAGHAPTVHLVPVVRSEAEEGSALLRFVTGLPGRVVRAGAAGIEWARGEAEAVWAVVEAEIASLATALELGWHYLHLPAEALELYRRRALFRDDQDDCTPAGKRPAPRPGGRRIAVLVGGFGSASGQAAVLDVDTRALGYADADVAQFSYAGGQAPGERRLADVGTAAYGQADSTGDIRAAGERFRDLLQQIRRHHPGVPVDVIAHSQGGLVVRSALGGDADHLDPRLPPVENVITLGSPHHGTDLATANQALGTSTAGQYAQFGAEALGIDPFSEAATQMSERSDLIEELDDRPLPRDARFTSIAARGDLTVPALQSGLDDAVNVVVPVDGISAHDRLPGSPEAEREIRLALAGQGPTCRDVVDSLWFALGASVAMDLGGAAALVGGRALDRGVFRRSAGPDHTRTDRPDAEVPARRTGR